jgi:hypothetical protein
LRANVKKSQRGRLNQESTVTDVLPVLSGEGKRVAIRLGRRRLALDAAGSATAPAAPSLRHLPGEPGASWRRNR